MEIPDSTNRLRLSNEPATTRQADTAARQTKAEPAAVHSAPEIERPEPPVYARAPEVVEFTTRLRELNDIRSDLVNAVSKLLAAGHYDTRGAAEKTAEKILGS